MAEDLANALHDWVDVTKRATDAINAYKQAIQDLEDYKNSISSKRGVVLDSVRRWMGKRQYTLTIRITAVINTGKAVQEIRLEWSKKCPGPRGLYHRDIY